MSLLGERLGQTPKGMLVVLLAALIAALTVAVAAWWMPAAVGIVVGVLSRPGGRGMTVLLPFVGGAVGWGGLMLLSATQGAFPRVPMVLSGLFGAPPLLVWLLTPAYGGLLAGAGALLGSAWRRGGVVSL